MGIASAIARAARTTGGVVANVQTSQFAQSTPCGEFEVGALVNHMTGFLVMTEMAARKQDLPDDSGEMPDFANADLGETYGQLSHKAVQAWSEPGALEGVCQFGPGEFPSQVAASITLLELAVHGWDMATATGQEYPIDGEVAEVLWEATKSIVSNDARNNGAFGPEVEVDQDAPLKDRILGLTGRDPSAGAR